MSLHLHEKSTIICGKNYGQKKVTINIIIVPLLLLLKEA